MERWLPRTLLGRIFSLLAASVLLFTLAGLAFIHNHHFKQEVDDANDTLNLLADAILPTLSDSAIIGDYDTIERTLDRISKSPTVSVARFTDNRGVVIEGSNGGEPDHAAPQWLVEQVSSRLVKIRRDVSVGGKNYGSLFLVFSAETIADDIWLMTRAYLVFAVLLLAPGLYLVRIPLKRMVSALAQVTEFATALKLHQKGQLRLNDTSVELEHLAHALNQVAIDLAEQHQALADSESRKSAILSAGLDCFITIDEAGKIIDFNRAAEQTFGYSADEVRGGLMSDFIIPPELRSRHEQGMAHWRRTGDGPVLHQRIEISAMRRSGEIFTVELAIVPFGSGDRQYFAGFMRDISQHKLLESERHYLEVAQRQMVSDLAAKQFAIDQHAIVSIAGPDGTIIYANERLQALSGYSSNELIGSNHRLLKSGLQDDSFYRELWQTISRGKVWHGEYANRSKDGQIYWVAATIVPMQGEKNSPHQYISIQTDITHQKRTEQQLGLFQEDLMRLLDQYRAAELEIAQSRARELMVGAQIQRTLLFGRMPRQYGNLGIATFTQPSQGIDGDFYEFFTFDQNTIDIVIGDVMGKGIPAALMGAAVKKQLNRSAAWLLSQNPIRGYRPEPEAIINDVQQRVGKDLLELESFVTLSYLRIDSTAGLAVLVDAGHLPVIQVSEHGARLLRGDNLPLGVLEDEHFRQTSVPASSGDIFFMYSDGITEARNANQEEFGIDRLVDLIQCMHREEIPPEMIVQNVRWHVNEFENHADAQDDRTCVALKMALPVPAEIEIRQFELPRALDQLAPLRSRIEAAGRDSAIDEDRTQAMVIAAFEAATNVVRHTPPRLTDGTIHCALTIQPGRLEVDFHYLGSAFTPHDREPDFSGESEGGFGLYIIRNSVDLVEYSSPVDGICRIHLAKMAQE